MTKYHRTIRNSNGKSSTSDTYRSGGTTTTITHSNGKTSTTRTERVGGTTYINRSSTSGTKKTNTPIIHKSITYSGTQYNQINPALIYPIVILGVTIIILLFALLAIYFIVLFLNSPGILVVWIFENYASISLSTFVKWIFSLSISLAIMCSFYFLLKNENKGKLWFFLYLTAAILAATPSLIIKTGDFYIYESIAYKWSGGIVFAKNLTNEKIDKRIEINRSKDVSKTIEKSDSIVAEQRLNNINPGFKVKHTSINGYALSLDCENVLNTSEKTICSKNDLLNLDLIMIKKYREIINHTQNSTSQKDYNESQIAWIRNLRLCDGNYSCIKKSYEKRIVELNSISLGAEAR